MSGDYIKTVVRSGRRRKRKDPWVITPGGFRIRRSVERIFNRFERDYRAALKRLADK